MTNRHSLDALTRIALLSSLCVVLRYAFAAFPNIKPITALFLICCVVLNFSEGLLIMTISMLVSSFLFGFGPWVIWQIISFTVIMLLWRYLLYPITKSLLLSDKFLLFLQAFIAGLLSILYGMTSDTIYAFIYQIPWWTYVLAGASFNLLHAVSTAIFYSLLMPILKEVFSK
ncbi:ECF transporter S component [Streptococcus sp. zg-JUN1979]|uniref:ECF transporter S component n=1 Tax=Streptococcus sp. zg-JUN1979 TaxID=3391450 RepID=UPI0039A69951